MRRLAFAALAAFVFSSTACGTDESAVEPGFGNLEVQVAGIHNGSAPAPSQVTKITLMLDGVAHDYTKELTAGAGDWATTFQKLYTGTYEARAQAFNAANEVIFESSPVSVTIAKDVSVGLIIVMHQQTTPGEFTPPYFQTVVVDRLQVEQGEVVHISVTAAGGIGAMSLSGRHALSAANPGTFAAAVPFVGDGASIDWTAPMVAGPAWFVLVVTDAENNKTELGVTVLVGNDRGALSASVRFNLAPTFDIETRTLNDRDAATFYIWVKNGSDDNTRDMRYAWTTNCAGVTWYNSEQGSLVNQATFMKMDIKAAADRAAKGGECVLSVTVADSEGASASQNLLLKTLEAPVTVAP